MIGKLLVADVKGENVGAPYTLWLPAPADKEWVVKVFTGHTNAVITLTWKIMQGSEVIESAPYVTTGVGDYYSISDAFPDLTMHEPFIITPDTYIGLEKTVGVGFQYISYVVLERKLAWELQELEWNILHSEATPPGLADLVSTELGYRGRLEML